MTSIWLALSGLLLLAASPAAQSLQQTPPVPVIIAQGEATVKQVADVASVQISVEARGAKPADARQQAAAAMTAVTTTLKKLVAADAVKTAAFSVQPELDYSSTPARVRGYVARNQLDVRVDDLETLAGVLDASVMSGATSVSGLRFDVKDRSRLEREALRQAVQDATERAQAMAAGAGRTLGAIVQIQEQRTSGMPIMSRQETLTARGGAQTTTPVTPGEIEIHGQVSLTAAIK